MIMRWLTQRDLVYRIERLDYGNYMKQEVTWPRWVFVGIIAACWLATALVTLVVEWGKR
jgi:hypothetical protein